MLLQFCMKVSVIGTFSKIRAGVKEYIYPECERKERPVLLPEQLARVSYYHMEPSGQKKLFTFTDINIGPIS